MSSAGVSSCTNGTSEGDHRRRGAASLTRLKGEITARMIEWDHPHIVELPLPSGGFPGTRPTERRVRSSTTYVPPE